MHKCLVNTSGVCASLCPKAFFTEDTALCLSTWTAQEDLTPKCASVRHLESVAYVTFHSFLSDSGSESKAIKKQAVKNS